MDLPVYVILGLVASGYLLNQNGKQARNTPPVSNKKREEQNENKKSGNHNIYDSAYFQKVREIEDEKVIPNFEKGFDPFNTNVIPHYFNTLNETNVKRVKNPMYDQNLFRKEMAKVLGNTPIS